jgi:hypothetical protein
VPRADLVLFVLSADRPLSESELAFLKYIRQWRKKVVFVVNKVCLRAGRVAPTLHHHLHACLLTGAAASCEEAVLPWRIHAALLCTTYVTRVIHASCCCVCLLLYVEASAEHLLCTYVC